MSETNSTSTTKRIWFGCKALDRRFRTTSLLWLAGIVLLSVPMVTLVDVSVARWFRQEPLPRELNELLEMTRVISHGGGVFLILLTLGLMSPERRWYIPRLGALAMGAGAISTLAKMFVLRPRPNGLNLNIATYDSAWLWAFDWELKQVATFDASTRAFPSSNMATAIALTVGLWVVIPRGRIVFMLLSFGAFLHCLQCGSHFPSDLVGGAAFGLTWAYACFHPRLLGSIFTQMEPKNGQRRRRPNPSDHSEDKNIIPLPIAIQERNAAIKQDSERDDYPETKAA